MTDWDKDNYGDLIAIDMSPGDKSNMVLRVFSGESDFQQCIRTFDLPLEKGSNYNFAVSSVRTRSDTELYAVKHTNTSSQKLEHHIIRFNEGRSFGFRRRNVTFKHFKETTQIPETNVKWQPALLNFERPFAENITLIDDIYDPKNVVVYRSLATSQKLFDGTPADLHAKLAETEKLELEKLQFVCGKAVLEGIGLYAANQFLPLVVTFGQGWAVITLTYDFVFDAKSCLEGLKISDTFQKWFLDPNNNGPEIPGGGRGGPGIKDRESIIKEHVGIVTIREDN